MRQHTECDCVRWRSLCRKSWNEKVDMVNLINEASSEKSLADIKAFLAKNNGKGAIACDPNDSPNARPVVEAFVMPAVTFQLFGIRLMIFIRGILVITRSSLVGFR